MITTVIPTYKRPHLLKRAIRSALDQTFPNIQVCVYDNASNDETEAVVQQMAANDPRVKYHCHTASVSAVENFQFGLSRIQTPLFSILADDDILLPNFYQTALSMLDRFPEACFFLGSAIDIDENGKIISANALNWSEVEYLTPPGGLFEVVRNYFNWIGALFRKEVLESVQLDARLKAIDFDFVCRLALKFPFTFSKIPCALFIHHSHSYSNHCGAKLVWPGWVKMVENLTSDPSLPPPIKRKIEALMGQTLEKILFRLAITSIVRKQFLEAAQILQIYLQEYPTKKALYLFIKGLLRTCETNPWLFQIFSRGFQSLIHFRRRSLQQKYEELAVFLNAKI